MGLSDYQGDHRWWLALLLLVAWGCGFGAEDEWERGVEFDDAPVIPEVAYPSWFKQSFLDLREDLQEAVSNHKRGLMVYFGQKHCAYCQALMQNDFGQPDIASYTRQHFDVVAIDIWGSKEVTTPDGAVMGERDYAMREKANFTPTLIYYDSKGRKALTLRGYHPPYKFRAAMEYVVEEYYQEESLAQYMARAEPVPAFELGALNEQPFFIAPPYALDRSHFRASQPLLVLFEQGDCYACDLLHSQPLQAAEIRALIDHFETVQLDIHSATPVLTPDGQRLTAKQWAEQLGIFYTPTLIAFDEAGTEIIRIDSVAHHYRLKSVLEYIVSKEYLDSANFMSWRFEVLPYSGR